MIRRMLRGPRGGGRRARGVPPGGGGRRAARQQEWSALGFLVEPQLTDPAIDNWLDGHYVARDATVAANGRLFLFLGGSWGIPARQRRITDEAARLGYHAINLNYPNSWTVGGLCAESDDPDCHLRVRLQIIDGGAHTDLVGVGPANSVVGRLRSLLRHLERELPEDGWGRFLVDGEPAWDAMVVAGHSQGGGHAALLGKLHTVARVVMLASPVDHLRGRRSQAPWLARPGATPADRYFGFVHALDRGADRVLSAWEALGMSAGGPVVDVDEALPPYGGSQRLVTRLRDVPRGKYHGCVVQDRVTPLDASGQPLYRPVWRYLLGA